MKQHERFLTMILKKPSEQTIDQKPKQAWKYLIGYSKQWRKSHFVDYLKGMP